MKFKTDMEIVDDYIDYYKERNFVNNLTIPEQVLYKCQIRDTLSFIFYKLHVRICELIRLLKGKSEWLKKIIRTSQRRKSYVELWYWSS